MSALADKRQSQSKSIKKLSMTLTSGKVAYQGGLACIALGTSKVVPGVSGGNIAPIGTFLENKDATSAAKVVQVELFREIWPEWWDNATSTDAVAASTDIGKVCYLFDDHTVTINPTVAAGRVPFGRVWAVDSLKGVLVEPFVDSARPVEEVASTTVAYTANDFAPTDVQHDAVYQITTTGAASTISLPVAARDGTRAYFVANGTANGHTVTYRDVATALTTALTASKAHMVEVLKVNGHWYAIAYVSP